MTQGKLQKWIKGKSVDGLFTEEYFLEIVEEAKKELVPEAFWIEWAKDKYEDDKQLVKDYKYLLLKLVEWFGS